MAVTVEQPAALGTARFHGPCKVGAFTYFNGAAELFHTEIGRYGSIAPDVVIGPGEHPLDHLSTHPFAFGGGGNRFKNNPAYDAIRAPGGSTVRHRPTLIGHDVWIGTRAFIRQGVTIGHGSVIAAHAVVTRDVPPYSIVGGVPGRVLRPRFDPATIDRLLALAWWDHSLDRAVVGELPLHDIVGSLDRLEKLKADGTLRPAAFTTKRRGGRWYQRLLG
ncbi:MAG: CatB-related O-acetyltransferase [Verrucomicrobiota bacterium]